MTLRRLEAPIDLLALHRAHPERYPHLLASSAHGTPQGRYDILLAHPGARLRFDGLRCERDGRPVEGAFLDLLDAWWAEERIPASACPLPFHGGWFIYLGYELGHWLEPSVHLGGAPMGLPVAFAERCPAAVIVDHHDGTSWWVEEGGQARLWPQFQADCAGLSPTEADDLPPFSLEEDAPQGFLDGVGLIREAILAGEIYQANLSRAWRGRFARPPEAADLFSRLARHNPGPFAALSRIDGQAIVSSSPERLVCARHGMAETRPIAGTRRRGADALEDQALKAELIVHPKERAEHIMLLDLERNDLGRVCRAGSVRVDEHMVIESYRHVHHIVSNVQGELRPEITPGRLLAAMFPGGTITGCPKLRCMQILAKLEACARGPYTGTLGYLNRDGSLDTNILIRTLHLQGQHFTLRAGAGIVADSEPLAELAETRAKARGLLRALGLHGA